MKKALFLVGAAGLLGVTLASCGGSECSGTGMFLCDGVCVDTLTSNNHCGECNNPCTAGASCQSGSCQCGAGLDFCNGQCVNTQTDNTHCGGCQRACAGGSSCSGGQCACSGGLTYCVDRCVNINADDANCGECLRSCSAGQRCIQGECVTSFNESCDGVDNDFDGLTDEDENGQPLQRACDNLCGPGTETCSNGTWQNCSAPASAEETCNEIDDDCDGLTDEGVATRYYEDYDLDGHGDPDEAYSTLACSKPDDGTSPNGGNWSENNQDCNDGYPCEGDPDCDPALIHPGAAESCDAVDNNCNNDVDEGCACGPVDSTRECGTDEGICLKGIQRCTVTGWSECAGAGYVPPQPAESCNGLDDDCDGETDEELADDAMENNDTCAQARRLENVFEGDPWRDVENLSIYHGAGISPDQDWFLIRAEEATHLECIFHPGEYQCNFLFHATLTVPADEDHQDYVFCVHAGGTCGHFDYIFCSDDPATGATYDPATRTYGLILAWDGICGLNDSWDFYVQVKAAAGASLNSCRHYSMGFRLTYDGTISDTCE